MKTLDQEHLLLLSKLEHYNKKKPSWICTQYLHLYQDMLQATGLISLIEVQISLNEDIFGSLKQENLSLLSKLEHDEERKSS